MTLALIAVFALVAGLVVFGLLAWERIVARRRAEEPGSSWGASERARAARPDATPDLPRGFGPGRRWFAVASQHPEAVAKALGLRTLMPANWRAGLAEPEPRAVFVSPPVAGFVFAVGGGVDAGSDTEALLAQVAALSRTFGVAAWFRADMAVERHGFVLARRGEVVRGYGTGLWCGEPTPAEHELGCYVADPRDRSGDPEPWWPDDRIVLAIAAAWTVDPSRLDARAVAAGVGLVGRA
jgi:hypothetical protein